MCHHITKNRKIMTATTTSTEQQVEKMGVFFEQLGHTPMAGRVFAFLLLGEPPYKDFYEIQAFLQASKSSISNALKGLMASGIVDYITFSGDRKRYFRVNTKNWKGLLKDQTQKGKEMNDMLKEVLENRKDSKHLDFNEELQSIFDFQDFLNRRMLEVIQEWEKQQ